MGLDDFAADAEISEYALQRTGIGFQFGLAQGLAVRSLGCREHGDRRQLEPGVWFAGRRTRGGFLARRAGGGRVVLFLLLDLFDLLVPFFVLQVLRRAGTATAEAPLVAVERRTPRRRCTRYQPPLG